MRASVKILKRVAPTVFLLSSIALNGLAFFSAYARPIEFSEPTGSTAASPVSDLGVKPTELPSIEDRALKPYSYKSANDPNFKMQRPPPRMVAPRKENLPGAFDQNESWTQLSPDKMLMKMQERDALKLPSGASAIKSFDPSATLWDPFNASRRTSDNKVDARNRFGEVNRSATVADYLTAKDPFAQDSSAAAFPDTSPDALEQKQQAERMEEFKRALNFQTPAMAPALNTPRSPAPAGNAYISEVENSSSRLPNELPKQFEIPKTPTAPRAPFAPGQNSLTPSTYVPPAIPKPRQISAPRRSF